MTRKKTLLILAIVLVLAVGAVVGVKLYNNHVDTINTVDEVVLAASQDELTAVKIQMGDETLTLKKAEDGTWQDADDTAFPLDQDKVAALLKDFESVHASFIIEDVEDYSQYGLDDPGCIVTLTTADGDKTLSLGGFSSMDQKRYISIGDGRAFLIDTDLMGDMTTDRETLAAVDTIAEVDTMQEVTLSGQNTLDLVYDPDGSYCYTDAYDWYLKDGVGMLPVMSANVIALTDAVANASTDERVTYTASTDDLSQYGLDTPAITLTVSGTVDGETADAEPTAASYTVYIGAVMQEGTDTNADGEAQEPTYDAYLRIGDSEKIYKVDESVYTTLRDATYNTLRPATVLSPDWDAVTGITFTVEDASYEVTTTAPAAQDGEDPEATAEPETTASADDEDTTVTYYMDDEMVSLDEFKSAAKALAITDFETDAQPGVLEFELTIATGKTDFPTITVTAYRVDANHCLIYVDGEKIGTANRDTTIALREQLLKLALGGYRYSVEEDA